MTQLGSNLRIADGATLTSFQSDSVHHFNYFLQPETIEFLGESLQIPP
jgi:hypothetical protein